jgi:hypothetical protein
MGASFLHFGLKDRSNKTESLYNKRGGSESASLKRNMATNRPATVSIGKITLAQWHPGFSFSGVFLSARHYSEVIDWHLNTDFP